MAFGDQQEAKPAEIVLRCRIDCDMDKFLDQEAMRATLEYRKISGFARAIITRSDVIRHSIALYRAQREDGTLEPVLWRDKNKAVANVK